MKNEAVVPTVTAKIYKKKFLFRKKPKPVKVYGKAKRLHNSGSLKCNVLMFSVCKFSQQSKNLIKKVTSNC